MHSDREVGQRQWNGIKEIVRERECICSTGLYPSGKKYLSISELSGSKPCSSRADSARTSTPGPRKLPACGSLPPPQESCMGWEEPQDGRCLGPRSPRGKEPLTSPSGTLITLCGSKKLALGPDLPEGMCSAPSLRMGGQVFTVGDRALEAGCWRRPCHSDGLQAKIWRKSKNKPRAPW